MNQKLHHVNDNVFLFVCLFVCLPIVVVDIESNLYKYLIQVLQQ